MQNYEKLRDSIIELEKALKFEEKALSENFYYSGIAKIFEVCLEYAWKYFKTRSIDEGLEVYSPKESIKIAGRLGLIDSVEKWLDFLETRNISVHDYLGLSKENYIKVIKDFHNEVKKLKL